MRDETAEVATFRRSDYRAPDFQIEGIDLEFDLDPVLTTVRSRLRVRRDPRSIGAPFRLDGEDLVVAVPQLAGAVGDELARRVPVGRPVNPVEVVGERSLAAAIAVDHIKLQVIFFLAVAAKDDAFAVG